MRAAAYRQQTATSAVWHQAECVGRLILASACPFPGADEKLQEIGGLPGSFAGHR
jgi:hypothetical protein